MKKLILSLDTYSWVKYCCGLLLSSSSEYQVIILNKERGFGGILNSDRLCMDAVAAQRRHDILRIGKKLNVTKLLNLNYIDYIDVEHLSMTIKLQSTLGGIQEIYYQNNYYLNSIIDVIGKTFGTTLFNFGGNSGEARKTIDTTKFSSKIQEIKDMMIGVSNIEQLDFPIIEQFY